MDQTSSTDQVTHFGHSMLKHFLFDPKYTNLNHGSFGTYPKSVRDQFRHYQDLAETHPDVFLRFDYPALLLEAREAAANLVNAPVEECVFVQNASTGVNTILRNLVYKEGDVIVYFDTVYGACEKTILHLLEIHPQLHAEKVEYEFPCSHDHIVSQFLDVVKKVKSSGQKPHVAVFDTIAAMPGVRFPFERLTRACKTEGILSCIDGAHGIGHIKMDLTALDADFLVTNLHKWLFVPRSCALLYVATRNHHLIRTTYPTSHGFVPQPRPGADKVRNPLPSMDRKSPFVALFQFVATIDNAPYYSVPEAIKFRQEICGGEEEIYEYIKDVVAKGAKQMAEILGTDVVASPNGTGELSDCAFANVRLPLTVGSGQGEVPTEGVRRVAYWIEEQLVSKHDTFVATYGYRGRFYCRMSGQIYLEEGDFAWVAEILKGLCEEVRHGKWKGAKA